MSRKLSVSAVVPTYNRADILPETLENIFRQSRRPDEIIVVDDGSTDRTFEILKSYGDRIRSVSINNSGDLVARNIGLKASNCDLVAFCDDDDLWHEDFINSMAKFWEVYEFPICAFSNFREIHSGKLSCQSKFESAPSGYWSSLRTFDDDYGQFTEEIVGKLIAFQPIFPSCLMVDRAKFLQIGAWDEGVSRMVGCDFATALRIAEHPPIGVLRRPSVSIRKHAGNVSRDVQRMNLGDADVLAYVLSTRPQLAAYANEIRLSIDRRRLAAFDTAFARGDFEAAKRIINLLVSSPLEVRHRVKRVILRLPASIRDPIWRVLCEGNTTPTR